MMYSDQIRWLTKASKWITETSFRIFIFLIPTHFLLIYVLAIPLEYHLKWFWRPWRHFVSENEIFRLISNESFALYPIYVISIITLVVFLLSKTHLDSYPVMRRILKAQLWYFATFGVLGMFFANVVWHIPLVAAWAIHVIIFDIPFY